MKQEIEILISDSSIRIDRLITAELEGFSRSAVQNLIAHGHVTLNGNAVSKRDKLSVGDRLVVKLPDISEGRVLPENIPLSIVYEDSDLLVVNKPKGMVVHPAPGNNEGTLVNALLYHCKDSLSSIGGALRPGIVHRIDKDTSGLLMVAKNDDAHADLAAQIKEHSFLREYSCVVYGIVKEDGTVDEAIGRSPKDRKRMSINGINARNAVSHYRVEEQYEGFTRLTVRLETGRTHQIRVHMAHIGHPIAGDAVYGPKKIISSLNGQCLHAGRLGFVHPSTREYMEFSSPLPEYFQEFIGRLRKLL